MVAGGVPTSAGWKPYEKAWLGTLSMQQWFKGVKEWWRSMAYSSVKVGDILSLNNDIGSYHVGVITVSNTASKAYSGHTNDLLNQVFTPTTFNGEAESVSYFTFNPMIISETID